MPDGPRNVIVVLLDSLNRHMLGAWGGTEFDTPNLDRFAARSVRFTKHYTGSLPCIPARHDLLTGALDFLWKPWGSLELWEEPVSYHLRRAGVTTMLISDHPHLFEAGGENYHTDFLAWEYLRGGESDPWKTRPDPSWLGAPALPAGTGGVYRPYDVNRSWFKSEEDFPGPKTMQAAADWVDANAGAHNRFLLFVDEFDPHEPFDTPAPWANRYDPDWDGDLIIWPPYAKAGVRKGHITERQGRHVRANYGSKLSMIDHWFGRLYDAIDRNDLWDDTAVIVCTDHGLYLGERDLWGKPSVMQYETLGHTPLMVAWPGVEPGEVDALTTNVDINATIVDVFGVRPQHRTHGASLVPLLIGETGAIREWAIGGYYGCWVQITDGDRKYARAPDGENAPLSMWSNRWSTMPIHGMPDLRLPKPDRRARLDFMPGSDVPVIRQTFGVHDPRPYWVDDSIVGRHECYDVREDPSEERNLAGEATEAEMIDVLRAALEAVDAPDEQLARLGIA